MLKYALPAAPVQPRRIHSAFGNGRGLAIATCFFAALILVEDRATAQKATNIINLDAVSNSQSNQGETDGKKYDYVWGRAHPHELLGDKYQRAHNYYKAAYSYLVAAKTILDEGGDILAKGDRNLILLLACEISNAIHALEEAGIPQQSERGLGLNATWWSLNEIRKQPTKGLNGKDINAGSYGLLGSVPPALRKKLQTAINNALRQLPNYKEQKAPKHQEPGEDFHP